ncbi:MAG TPA: acetate--CoA ligase family protein [Xanthobacteraceae bacterium]|nr:acetate--CoA ligase family protein [Xanthobacteraceae bacterium]
MLFFGRPVMAQTSVALICSEWPMQNSALRVSHGGIINETKLLTGFRGKLPADIDALVEAIHRLSHVVADHDGAVTELDITPLIVAEAGQGAVVAALISRGDVP